MNYISKRIHRHINALIHLFIKAELPPEVVDEALDRFKAMYKPLYEHLKGDKDAESMVQDMSSIVSATDMKPEEKDELLMRLKGVE